MVKNISDLLEAFKIGIGRLIEHIGIFKILFIAGIIPISIGHFSIAPVNLLSVLVLLGWVSYYYLILTFALWGKR